MNGTTAKIRALGTVSVAAVFALAGCLGGKAKKEQFQTDYEQCINRHMAEADALSTGPAQSYAAKDLPKVPASYRPWWREPITKPVIDTSKPQPHTLEDMYDRALVHSSQIKVFSDIPLIRETGVQEAEGRFDIRGFVETKYERTKEPVGSLLTSRTRTTFNEKEMSFEGGLKRKMETGADVVLSQKVGFTTNNSEFLAPNPQMEARLTLSVVQPLLRGAGVRYNKSIIRIAHIDSEIARSEFIRQAQSHLMEISRSYWATYLARGVFLQKKQLVVDTAEVVGRIKRRADIDAVRSQLVRSESALAERRAELVRAEMAIRNAEDRMRALINDPELMVGTTVELIPTTAPATGEMDVGARQSAVVALKNRPEIDQGFRQLKSLAIRRNMAKNELLPQVNVIVEGSLNGLDRNKHVGDAWGSEFERGSYMVGLSVEYPFGNNEANARHSRRQLEIRQQMAQINTTIETILLEVKVAVRELQTAYREMQAKYQALKAAEADVSTLKERWGLAALTDGRGGSAYLEFLVDSQGRLAKAQEDLLRSTVAYNVSITNLERAKGTLLKYEEIEIERDIGPKRLPSMHLRRSPAKKDAPPDTKAKQP